MSIRSPKIQLMPIDRLRFVRQVIADEALALTKVAEHLSAAAVEAA